MFEHEMANLAWSLEYSAIRQALAGAQRILVVSHIRPDGDAIGALLGLGLALQGAGKDVQMVLADGLPANFRFLEGSQQVQNRVTAPFDLLCVVDCSDPQRMGNLFSETVTVDINIDHHVTNLNFGRVNLVDTKAVSTTEIIADLLTALEITISPAAASALLVGLITDTIGFRVPSITAKALRLAGDLMEKGADLSDLYYRTLVARSFEAARYWGLGLSKLERQGRLAWTELTLADRQKANYPGRDDADITNILGALEGVDIALLFLEQPDQRVKVSWRAKAGYDVSQLAASFGGGGHPAAAGADIPGTLPQVRQMVLEKTRPLLNGKNSSVEGKEAS